MNRTEDSVVDTGGDEVLGAQTEHRINVIIKMLEALVLPLFNPGTCATVIVHVPDDTECEMVVTTEGDLDKLIAVLERAKERRAHL